MSRDTVCFSMYSVMSKRRNSTPSTRASCLASSVLPTPVGPEKRNEPIGFSGGPRPERESLMRRTSASMARVLTVDDLLAARARAAPAPARRRPRPICAGIFAIFATTCLDLVGRRAVACRSASRQQPLDRARLVDDVDRLVGQVAIVDVLGGQLGRGPQRLVGVVDVVVLLVARASGPAGSGRSPRPTARSTSIFWKRRASARSRSKEALYSWNVVEPMQRSSPEASAGLSRFDASIEPPLVAPAPTMVWISSMNRIAFGLFLIALDHALEPLLELAAELGAGEQRAHVERVDLAPCAAARARASRGSPAPGPRRSRSCRRPARRRRSGCSCAAGTAPGWLRSSSALRPISGSMLALLGALDEVDGVGLERILGRRRRLVLALVGPSPPRRLLAAARRRRLVLG